MTFDAPWPLWQKVQLVEVVILWIVLNGGAPLLARFWLRTMEPHRRENRWSWDYWAVLMTSTFYGPFVLVPFAWRTRRERGVVAGLKALATGLLLSLVLVGVYVGFAYLLSLAAESIFGEAAIPPLERAQ